MPNFAIEIPCGVAALEPTAGTGTPSFEDRQLTLIISATSQIDAMRRLVYALERIANSVTPTLTPETLCGSRDDDPG